MGRGRLEVLAAALHLTADELLHSPYPARVAILRHSQERIASVLWIAPEKVTITIADSE